MKSNKVEPVYGHFEIDGYEPCFMEKDVDSQEYEIIRAVPPNVQPKFFISHRGKPKISSRYQLSYINEPIHKEMHFTENSVLSVRVMIVQNHTVYGEASDLSVEFEAKPRFDNDQVKPELVIELNEWTLEKSLFKDMYIKPETYDKCLGTDFTNSRIGKFIQNLNDIEPIKKDLRALYPQILSCYKHFASQNVKADNVWISRAEMIIFLEKFGILDEVTY